MPGFLDELGRATHPGHDVNLGASVSLGLTVNPDKEAEVRRKAQRLGVQPEVIRDSDETARTVEVQSIVEETAQSPRTQSFLSLSLIHI